MKTLYLECAMGAAGDMLMGALYQLLPDQEGFLRTMNGLLPSVTVAAVPRVTCGIMGTHIEVKVAGEEEHTRDVHAEHHEHHQDHHHHGDHHEEHHHHHASLPHIRSLINGLALPDRVKGEVAAVYDRIAGAEAKAHGVPVDQVHFHEVGALDAVADVAGVCLALSLLGAEQIICSPVHVGFGQVKCAHGIMPVPAPATAELLRGIPSLGGVIEGELCTPTGAALIGHFAGAFGPMPAMVTEKIGCGVGSKEFPAPNCVRAFWGETADGGRDEVCELVCHIDDMTGESVAFALQRLLDAGALDAVTAPITMKKGRPGLALTVLCRPEDEKAMAQAVLRETTTNGLRVRRCPRYVLTPSVQVRETEFGTIRYKCGDGYGIHREKPEYDDLAAAARKSGLSIGELTARLGK